jgi:hypothetical protein
MYCSGNFPFGATIDDIIYEATQLSAARRIPEGCHTADHVAEIEAR